MKKLIALFVLLLGLGLTKSQAQTTTNIAYRITVETVTAGVTNSVNTNYRFDYGVKKDAFRVDGINLAYASYVTAQGTNAVLTIGQWLKQQHNVLIDAYASQKQQADNQALLAKLTSLLTSNVDLLSASDLTSLNTIAAKAP